MEPSDVNPAQQQQRSKLFRYRPLCACVYNTRNASSIIAWTAAGTRFPKLFPSDSKQGGRQDGSKSSLRPSSLYGPSFNIIHILLLAVHSLCAVIYRAGCHYYQFRHLPDPISSLSLSSFIDLHNISELCRRTVGCNEPIIKAVPPTIEHDRAVYPSARVDERRFSFISSV